MRAQLEGSGADAVTGSRTQSIMAKDKKKAKAEAAKAAAQQAVTVPLKEMDDVTAAAMTINEGLEGDEDFLFGGDDMFDFENEDISDLLG